LPVICPALSVSCGDGLFDAGGRFVVVVDGDAVVMFEGDFFADAGRLARR